MASNSRTTMLGAGKVISNPKTASTHQEVMKTPLMEEDITAHEMANALRFLAIDAVEEARSGHPGMPMGAADIITTLWTKFIHFDPNRPDWIDRDRFILSAGHGSMLLYALLYLIGTKGVNLDDLKQFRQFNSRTPGHPERSCLPGVEVTTGPLGQGLGMAVGMAIAQSHLNGLYKDDIINHHVYVLASDGDLMEGISHESISLAGHLGLGSLIILYDSNDITIDGAKSLADSHHVETRFQSAHWHVQTIDGHNHQNIADALSAAQKSEAPSLIVCQTKIGFGAPNKEASAQVHGAPLGEEEVLATREALRWKGRPFRVPSRILDEWRITGLKIARKHVEWQKRWNGLPEATQNEVTRRFDNDLPDGLRVAITQLKRKLAREDEMATRKASNVVLERVNKLFPEMMGGSADLTSSNQTKTSEQTIFSAQNHSGQYIHYGVREHAMAAAMNGMAAHGGVLPYGGTFLVFSDYMRPSLRLAAMMGLRVIYIFSHDSIGLGEDGPTHQPIEHLASLRAIPNLNVFRPADAVEVAESWEIALTQKRTPSAILLTRQEVPILRHVRSEQNRCRNGAYEIKPVDGIEDITLIASGSEVALAIEASRKIESERVSTRVISMPCLDLFLKQSLEYQTQMIGGGEIRIIIEAASNSNWQDIAGPDSHFIGLNQFGASAPYRELYAHFGLTADKIAKTSIDMLEQRRQRKGEDL